MAILKDLIVHGSSRFLNKIYASEIQTPLIDAEAGIFKKLKADDATVVGLLDVQGQMHTNSWTNSNIATIDGSFYITPTLSSSSGTVSFSSATAATFTGTYSAVSSLYIGNNTASTVQWTSGSKILITGEVQVDEEWIPLGTLLGTLNSTNPTTSMSIVNITDNRNNTSNILTNIYSLKSNDSLSYRNLKISLYQRADNSEYYPLGIFMTALGQNGKTFLDIYGGVNVLTTSYGGYANPNVRIGNLSGLPAITTAAGNFTPVGWGIYTTNGYFSGTIVSNTGVIGGWKLGANSLYNKTAGLNDNTVGIYLGTDGIRNYQDTDTYVNITEGVIEAKGVNLTGTINATAGNIGGASITGGVLTVPAAYISGELTAATINGSKITANTITASQIATNAITADELAANAVTSTKIKAGEVKADNIAANAVTAGKISVDSLSAITANLGTITAGVIKHDTVGGTNGIWFSADTDTSSNVTIGNSTARKDWRLLVNNKFGVTKEGNLYASNVDLTGKITATSGTIGGIEIENGALKVSSINIGNLGGASNYAQKTDVAQAIDNIEIEGRNLLRYNVKNYAFSVSKIIEDEFYRGMYASIEEGKTYTISRKIVEGNRFRLYTTQVEPAVNVAAQALKVDDDTLLKYTFIAPSGANYLFIYLSNQSDNINNGNIKLEIGNKATDWAPAPEDIEADIDDARKVAINYLAVDNTGIMVADMEHGEQTPSTATGRNVFIDNDSVNIRKGTTTLASFTGDNTKFYDPIYNKELATFGAGGAIIGANSEQRFIIEKDGIKSINDNGATVFSINSTEGTVVTEAEVAPSGETNFMNTTFATLDTVGSGFSTDVTFYNKSLTAIIEISNCNSTLKNVKVNSVSSNATLIKVGINTRTYSIVLPPFTFAYGTNKTISYTITASFVNTYGDSYNLTAVETITYNGTATIGLSPLDGECVRTSGNNQEISEFMGLWSKVIYGEIYQSSAYTKAPAMTFGTRGKDAIMAPFSVTMGESLYANNDNQLSIGRYNLNNDEFFPLAFAIGNGTSDNDRSNAFNVDWDGNIEVAGGITVSGNETIDGGLNIRGGLTVGGNETLTGILTVNNNIKVKGRFLNSAGNPLFKVVTAAKDNITISANNGAYPSITVSAAGYTPVAIAQVHLANATNRPSSYAHYTWVTCSSFALSGSTISCYTGNWNTSAAAMIKLTFKVLCILNTAL